MQKNPINEGDSIQEPMTLQAYEDAVSLPDGIYPITDDAGTVLDASVVSYNSETVEDVLNRLQHINLSSYTNITSVLPYTVVDDVAQIKITASTGGVQYGGVDVTINGLTVFAMGKLTAGTEDFSQQIAFRVYKGDVISGNINPAGGSLRVDLAKRT